MKETSDVYLMYEMDAFVKKMMNKLGRKYGREFGYLEVVRMIQSNAGDMLNEE